MKKQTEIKQRSWIDWFCKLIPMSVRITCKTIFIEWRVRLQTIDWTKIPIRFVFSRNSTEAIKLRRQQHSYRWAVVMIVSHTKHSEKNSKQTHTENISVVRPTRERKGNRLLFIVLQFHWIVQQQASWRQKSMNPHEAKPIVDNDIENIIDSTSRVDRAVHAANDMNLIFTAHIYSCTVGWMRLKKRQNQWINIYRKMKHSFFLWMQPRFERFYFRM